MLLGCVPALIGRKTLQLTGPQASAVNALIHSGSPALGQLGVQYGIFMGSASSVALNRTDLGLVAAGFTGGALPPSPQGAAQFPTPVACPAGQPVNNGATCSMFGGYVAPLPASFVGLRDIRGN